MLASLITGIVTGEAAMAAKRAKTAAGAYGVAALLIAIGAVFLLVAGFLAAAARIGPLYAALAFGGGFLLVGLLIVLLHRSEAARQARRDKERRAREAATIAEATALTLLSSLPRGRRTLPWLGLAGAALAGYVIYRENRRPLEPPPGPVRPR